MNTASKEKIGVAVFGVFTLLFLFLGVAQMKNHLNPWQRPRNANDPTIEDIQKEFGSKDTDGDGLSDILEQTLYETSAYLPDSDSDGVPDGIEIERGDNPLCPYGQQCLRGTLGIVLNEPGVGVDAPGIGTGTQPSDISDMSAPQIRAMLIEAGAPREQVDALSDEQLKELYRETAQTANTSKEEQIVSAFLSQDVTAIRKILKDQGVPEDVLNSVSDEELKEVFRSALEQGR